MFERERDASIVSFFWFFSFRVVVSPFFFFFVCFLSPGKGLVRSENRDPEDDTFRRARLEDQIKRKKKHIFLNQDKILVKIKNIFSRSLL